MDVEMEKTLLLVDDEENILRSLRRLFRRDGYRILTALGGAEGLELLKQETVGVIVSDQRMPEMTGSEFLHQVKALYPETVRIILSGYTDLESVTDSINRGAVYKFLTKPWDDELLCENVREAFRVHDLNSENIRLAEELRQVNSELEAHVVQKDSELQFNVQVLKISQDILEELPIAVLGISQDQIVVTNRYARELFSDTATMMMGAGVEEVCPQALVSLYQQAVTDDSASGEVTVGGTRLRCQCQRNASDGPHDGFIMTLRD